MQTRAIRFHQLGGPEVLQIESVELAPPGPGEVQIRVEAIGINRAEAAFRAGLYIEQPYLPAGLGYEASGVVEALGAEVTDYQVGDAVCVIPAFSMNHYGVYAEHCNVPARALLPRPAGLNAIEAASLWMAHLTAYGALIDIAELSRGDAVLVPAASSSVGLAVMQFARRLDAVPIAITRSAHKADWLRQHGAEHVLVNPGPDLAAEVLQLTGGRGAKLALDPVGGDGVMQLASALCPGGSLVLYGNLSGQAEHTPFPFYAAVGKGLSLRGYLVFEVLGDPQRLAAARHCIESGLANGRLHTVVDRVFPFEQIVDAHRYLESNHQVGKVVVSLL